jgi:beta-propeller repeat-containing protein
MSKRLYGFVLVSLVVAGAAASCTEDTGDAGAAGATTTSTGAGGATSSTSQSTTTSTGPAQGGGGLGQGGGGAGAGGTGDGGGGASSSGGAGPGGSGAGGGGGLGGGGAGGTGGDPLFSRYLDNAYLWAVAAGQQGDVFAVGDVVGTTDFGAGMVTSAGAHDFWVAKYDAADNLVFAELFGDAAEQQGRCAAADPSGGVVVAGNAQGVIDFGGGPLPDNASNDAVVAHLGTSGNEVWARRSLGGSAMYRAIALDAGGAVHLTGAASNTPVDFGGGPLSGGGFSDVIVVKLDASGNHLWSKRVGAAQNQIGEGIAVDGAGNVYVSGWFFGNMTFAGGPTLVSSGVFDIFLARLDAAGNHVWSKKFGDAQSQLALAAACDAAGNVVIVGMQAGTVDYGGGPLTAAGNEVLVARFDANGNHLWSHLYGGGVDGAAYGVALDGNGDIVVSGYFEGTVDFGGGPLVSSGGHDMFVAKLAASSAHLWSRAFGGPGEQEARPVAADAAGLIIVGGTFDSTITFGPTTFTATGTDGFLVRLAP